MVTLAAKAGMTEQELLVQAQVARICRASDYDPKSKEVILWTPSMYILGRTSGPLLTVHVQWDKPSCKH
ncbi:exonuclease [Enterobacter phage 03_vB_Eclo_IJM]|nr:exonuclease [Enterobacter phage 03_vB_Eclo_IJM]